MPITTYATLATMQQATDPEICAALETFRYPPVVEVHQVVTRKRHWWSRRQVKCLYSILWPLGETLLGHEWQIINFHRDASDTSINTVVPKELVLAYLYGCGAGERQHDHEETT
jgi:hypothetical protein